MLTCDQALEMLTEAEGHELSPSLLRHVANCRDCQAEMMAWKASGLASLQFPGGALGIEACDSIEPEAYTGVLDRVFRSVVDEKDEIEDQRAAAETLTAEILGLSSNQQRLLIRNSGRYQVWGLAEALLARAREGWTEDPCRSEELVQLAVEVADQLKVTGFRLQLLNDLKAEAWSYIGNCRRIQSNYHDAAKAFRQAELLLGQGSGDRLERARVLDFEASLLIDQGAFKRAEGLLTESIKEYRIAQDKHLEGRALFKKAKLLRDCGLVEQTIPVLQRAASLVDVSREPSLDFAMKRNLFLHLLEAGRVEEAQRLLPEVRELAREFGSRLERLRLLWTEGLLCKALGQLDLAREALMQVREGFVAAEIGNDVALVSLDLALVHFEAGNTLEVRRLAVESAPLFASRGVQREVIMAWSLFREAAEQDSVTLGLVQEVASRIRQARGRSSGGSDSP